MFRDEFDFINAIKRRAPQRGGGLRIGIGDDAAVVRHNHESDFVVTSDLLVEDVDFRRAYSPPRLLGHKALAVSLSDIAAMGARPRFCLLSIGIPRDVWRTKFTDQFYEGFFALAEQHSVTLIGGDVSQTPERIVIDSIVIGEAERKRAVLRSEARAGDYVFVTGALGGAAAGLQLLERGSRFSTRQGAEKHLSAAKDARLHLMLRQLRPEPRMAWGEFLGRERLAKAMIDISDGLSSDLAHLCRASGVGARIDAELIPVDSYISNIQSSNLKFSEKNSLEFALHGGEDYEILFTVRPRSARALPKTLDGVPATQIGEITNKSGRIEIRHDSRAQILLPNGFTHFRRSK